MSLLFGETRSLRMALRFVSLLVRVPGGGTIVAGLGHTTPPIRARRRLAGVQIAAPVGASVSAGPAADAVRALPPLGAGLIEVGPVPRARIAEFQRILENKRAPVALRVAGDDAAPVISALAKDADLVVLDIGSVPDGASLATQESLHIPVLMAGRSRDLERVPPSIGVMLREGTPAEVSKLKDGRPLVLVSTSNPSIGKTIDLIASGADAVLVEQEGLIESGPGWFHRATGRLLTRSEPGAAEAGVAPLAWLAGVGLGLGMIAGGIGAAVVALGPVLLPYDARFLDVDASALRRLNPQLIHFLQHDRITLAGTMVALGILYAALSWWGIRVGRVWARDAVLASGVVGFPTLFYFFAYHYVEPVHVLLAVILFPLFLLAVWRRPPKRLDLPDGDEDPGDRRAALVGQLLMALIGFGLIAGGITISFVGVTAVFVPSDLTYMSTSAAALAAANDRLLDFIAHDRAGFGGALISTGVLVMLISTWGWHRGESWVWWSLAAAAAVGFGAAVGVHVWVGYVDFFHLAPVYAGSVVAAIALGLSRRYFFHRPTQTLSP